MIKHGSYRIGASVARTTVWMQEAVYHAGVKLLLRLGSTGSVLGVLYTFCGMGFLICKKDDASLLTSVLSFSSPSVRTTPPTQMGGAQLV